jgi:hypothetical protein
MAFMVLAASEYIDATQPDSYSGAGIAAILPNPRKFTASLRPTLINASQKITKVMRTVGKIITKCALKNPFCFFSLLYGSNMSKLKSEIG